MATTTLSVKYRHTRIGFLVREGDIDDLVQVAGINTLLWGGVYNPIVPVGSANREFTDQLMNLFSVDVLFPVSSTKEIKDVIEDNPLLRDPEHYPNEIFYQDWHTKKNILGYLDVINLYTYYWEKEFKNDPQRSSNCAMPKWDMADPNASLLSILFGYFPTNYNLKDNFENYFLKGLRAKKVKVNPSRPLGKNFGTLLSPIDITGSKLRGYYGSRHEDGVYIGAGNDFTDLVNFWNLRASGLTLSFFPKDTPKRFNGLLRTHIKRLDKQPSRNPNIEYPITAYYRDDHNQVRKIVEAYRGKKPFALSKCDATSWNGLNIEPSTFYFDWQQVLANVEKKYDKYNVSASLPEKRFLIRDHEDHRKEVGSQHLAISIDPHSEYEYPRHTLKPPFLRALNEFYSREIDINPFKVRTERDGIGILSKVHDNSISLYPLSHQKLIERIIELTGRKVEMSQPGLLAQQIINGMRDDDPLEACRVFKITGVRELIASPKVKNGKSIKWSKAVQLIYENNFKKFEGLYIESRKSKKLGTNNVFNYLVRKKVLSPKLRLVSKVLRLRHSFKCRNCGLEDRISIIHFSGYWSCPYCEHHHFMPGYILEDFQGQQNKYWRFSRSGLFAKDNNQEGAIPVILTLLALARIFDGHNLTYSTSLNLIDAPQCEIDFCVLNTDHSKDIQIGIGECKSAKQKIDQQDIDNLKRVQDSLNGIGLDCFLIFSKPVDAYEADEIELFRSLESDGRKFVVLSNKELEPYHPYWEMEETDQLPEKYTLDFEGMYRNSLFLYLGQS